MEHMVKMMLSELGWHSHLLLYGFKILDFTPSFLFSMLVMACFCHNKCHKIYKFPIGNIWRNVILMLFDLRYNLQKIILLMMKESWWVLTSSKWCITRGNVKHISFFKTKYCDQRGRGKLYLIYVISTTCSSSYWFIHFHK